MSKTGNFAATLKQYMEEAFFSLRRLSEKSDIPKGTLRHWVTGAVKPSGELWQRVIQIANALELDINKANRLLTEAGCPTIQELLNSNLVAEDQGLLFRWAALPDSPKKGAWHGIVDIDPQGLAVIAGYNLFFSCKATGRWQIWHLDSSSGIVCPLRFQLSEATQILDQVDQFVPVVSPANDWIVFAAGFGGDRPKRDLYLAKLDLAKLKGMDVERLTDSSLDHYHPCFSPKDSRWLIYHAGSAKTPQQSEIKYGIEVVDWRSNKPAHQLTQENDYDPVFSPNGRYIAYHSLLPRPAIKILDFAAWSSSSKVSEPLKWTAVDTQGQVSSVGWINNHHIVFSMKVENKWEIYKAPVFQNRPSHNPEKLTQNEWDNVYPALFGDKLLLWQAFHHEKFGDEGESTDHISELHVMDLDDQQEVALVNGVGNARDGFLYTPSRSRPSDKSP